MMRYVLSNSNNNSDSDLIDHPFPISLLYYLVKLQRPIMKPDFRPLHKMHRNPLSPTLSQDFDVMRGFIRLDGKGLTRSNKKEM